jgi:hypothetical protein
MSSLSYFKNIIKNFSFEELEGAGSRYPKFGKAGRKDFLFTCKRCGSQSDHMKFNHDIKYRLASHLVSNCHPSKAVSESEEEKEEEQQQDQRRRNRYELF